MPAWADQGCPQSLGGAAQPGKSGIVTAISAPFTLKLDDGRTIRLAGLELPESDWRQQAATWLEAHARGRHVIPCLMPTGKSDRYGRVTAQAVLEGGAWLQQGLLEDGLARVRALPDTAPATRALYGFEDTARQAEQGIWGDSRFGLRDENTVGKHLYSEEIVEARIRKTADIRGRVFLNFGDDWKTDFTVMIDKSAMRRFTAAGLDPLSWEGQIIRVRGWVDEYNGPEIAVTHPEQVEIVNPPTSYNPD